jgi:hypothetical protein
VDSVGRRRWVTDPTCPLHKDGYEDRDDRAEAARVKADAVAAVKAGADSEWFARAVGAVRAVAAMSSEFTTDDVWQMMGHEDARENRAMGAVMKEAERVGVCVPTDRYESSADPRCHGRPKRVWRARAGPASAPSVPTREADK